MGKLRKMEEVSKKKQSFYDELKGEWDMHSADVSAMCLGESVDTQVGILIAFIEGIV